jgi:hypothetical protein
MWRATEVFINSFDNPGLSHRIKQITEVSLGTKNWIG